MAVNLSRNTKVYFTTNVANTGHTNSNTWEIQVLNGYTFSQNTEAATIQLNEAGATPVRGSRNFNTKLNPVDWKISTYLRPYKPASLVTCPERYMWNALFGNKAIVENSAHAAISSATAAAAVVSNGTTAYTVTVTASAAHGLTTGATSPNIGQVANIYGATGTGTSINGNWKIASVPTTTSISVVVYGASGTPVPTVTNAKVAFSPWFEQTAVAQVSSVGSNFHQMQTFGLIFQVDNSTYKIANCAINQGDINFDIAGIAQVDFTGFGTTLTDISGVIGTELSTITAAPTAASFITNKLSTMTLVGGIEGSGTTYNLPITGGSISINNNIQYVTPDILGVINSPIGYFTGSREVSGNVTAYLKTGTNNTGQLLSDIITANSIEPKFKMQIEVGGINNTTRVEFLMNGANLQVPTVDIQDVVSTQINFKAQGYVEGSQVYDVAATNDIKVSYYI